MQHISPRMHCGYQAKIMLRCRHDPPPPCTMQVLHFEKDFHYTDRDLLTVARKIGKLATHCRRLKDEGSSIRVEVEARETKKANDQIKMMITVTLPRKTMRAESRKPTVVECADRCVEKLEPQLTKYKELHSRRGRSQAKQRRRRRS